MPSDDSKRPIEGRLVDGESPEPAYYVPQMTGWRRVALWLLETEAGITVIGLFMVGTAALAYNYVGLLVAGLWAGFIGGFLAGYWIAHRHFITTGDVPPP